MVRAISIFRERIFPISKDLSSSGARNMHVRAVKYRQVGHAICTLELSSIKYKVYVLRRASTVTLSRTQSAKTYNDPRVC